MEIWLLVAKFIWIFLQIHGLYDEITAAVTHLHELYNDVEVQVAFNIR